MSDPVAWMDVHDNTNLYYRKPTQVDVVPLYTHSPARAAALAAHESYWHKVADERAAEIVRLWEDAARYRLLRENACESYPSGEGSNNKDAYLVITGYDDLYPMTNEQKDAAVDEALRITKEWNE